MPTLQLTAKLGIDGRGFKAGLKEAEIAGNRFAGNLKNQLAAAFTVGAATAFLKNLGDTVGRIKDLADQYSITTDEVQRADVALRKNGLQFENLGHSIQKIGQARREAVEGNKELRDTFAQYGVTLQNLNDPQKRNYDLILQIASAIHGQNLTARDQVLLTDLLGARSLKLITTLQSLQDFNGVQIFTQEDVQLIDDANKKLEETARRLRVIVAAGIVEGSRNPLQFVADFLKGVAPTAPVPAGLNALGQLIDKFAPKPTDTWPLSPLDVVNANIEKSNRTAAALGAGTLFEEDKDVKRGSGVGGFRVDRPAGFGQGGGTSQGFQSGFNPMVVVGQQQVKILNKIESNTRPNRTPNTGNPFR